MENEKEKKKKKSLWDTYTQQRTKKDPDAKVEWANTGKMKQISDSFKGKK